jgi:PKD repeat protein
VIMAGNLPANQMPVARIDPNPAETFPNPTVTQFNDTSTDADGTITAWAWTFGDSGGGGTSTLQNPTYVYQAQGPRTVTLTVTDNLLGQATTQRTIQVADPNQGQDVTWTKLKGVAPVAPSGLIKTLVNNTNWNTGGFTRGCPERC